MHSVDPVALEGSWAGRETDTLSISIRDSVRRTHACALIRRAETLHAMVRGQICVVLRDSAAVLSPTIKLDQGQYTLTTTDQAHTL